MLLMNWYVHKSEYCADVQNKELLCSDKGSGVY